MTKHHNLITGKPIEPWVQDYLDEREAQRHSEEAEIERIVQSVTANFRRALRSIMRRRK